MIQRIFRYLRNFELAVACTVFGAALIVLFINVILRQFLNSALPWAEEFMRYAIIWVTFFACSLCAEDNLHVGIDVFIQMAKPPLRKAMRIFGMLCAAAFSAFMIEFSLRNTALLFETAQKSPVMLLPMWIVYVCMPLGALLTTLRFLKKAIEYIRMKPAEFADKEESAEDIDLLTLN